MKTPYSQSQDAAKDIYFGQIVIIWARWFFILGGALLALWSARTMSELGGTILLVAVLMAINFFVHARYLTERPANQFFLVGVSLLDLALVTLLVCGWQENAGLQNQLFIFYYPLLFAFALVFPPKATAAYTFLALALYAGVCVWLDPALVFSRGELAVGIIRLITLAAMGGLGTYYYRIQRQRRAEAGSVPGALA